MSTAERISSEVRRLFQTIDALKRQLAVSVPRTELEAARSKFEADLQVTRQQCEDALSRVRGELTDARNTRALIDTITAGIEQLGGQFDALATQVNTCFADFGKHLQGEERARTLEGQVTEFTARVAEMVPRAELEELHRRTAELEARLGEAEARAVDAEAKLNVATQEAQGLRSKIGEIESLLAQQLPATETRDVPEVSEVQSQLSELQTQTATAPTPVAPPSPPPAATPAAPKRVPEDAAFRFGDSGCVAHSAEEFCACITRLPPEVVETHTYNGDFDRWFLNVLGDEPTATRIAALVTNNIRGAALQQALLETVRGPVYAEAVQGGGGPAPAPP